MMPFLSKLFQPLLQFLVGTILTAIVDYVKGKIEEANMKKRIREKAKEIMLEKDPVVRAKRMSDLLGD